MPGKLLLIEDDDSFARRMQANLRTAGFPVDIANTGAAAMEALHESFYDLVVTDIKLPDINGLEILRRIKEGRNDGLDPTMPVVVLTSVRDVDTAVAAMRDGAADYLTKESEKQEIILRIERILDQSALLNENRYLRDQLERHNEFREMIGESAAMRAIKDEISQLAGERIPVLITGETGVGKELVARALHRVSATSKGPFIDVNCGALPDENLLLSELFGHERGAFTGAVALKRGKFELAQDGTLFLDEIGEMPLNAQARMLKVIETLEFTRLGGSHQICSSCRLIFATNKNLAEEVKAGRFRQDLYYRVNLLPIELPSLRERRDDIPLIARFYLTQFCNLYRKSPRRFDEEALAALCAYNWPGNVRELRNVVERLVIRSRSEDITRDELERCGVSLLSGFTGSAIELPQEGIALEEVERQLVVQALERCEWNQKQAAQLLQISVDRMNARVKKFNLTHPSWRVHR